MDYLGYAKFFYVHTKRSVLGKVSNALVAMHVRFTPNRATDDGFNEVVLEQIRYYQRRIEQVRYTQWREMIELAEKLGLYIPIDEKIKVVEQYFNENELAEYRKNVKDLLDPML